jgi:hypothetical protein
LTLFAIDRFTDGAKIDARPSQTTTMALDREAVRFDRDIILEGITPTAYASCGLNR